MPKKDYYLPARQLTTQQGAEIIQPPRVPRSKFHNTWSRLTTMNAADVIPFMIDDILPGDHMSYNVTALVRMATLLFPQFTKQEIETFFFFVPYRLLWTNYVKMMGEQASPGDSIVYAIPQLDVPAADWTIGSLFDQFGLPQVPAGKTLTVSALPFRAYYEIYNQWFRDENMSGGIVVPKGDGPDATGFYTIFRRAKYHDYFTSALPWTQKFTAPFVPLAGQASIFGIGFANQTLAGAATNAYETQPSNRANPFSYTNRKASNVDAVYFQQDPATGNPLIYADLSTASGFIINNFRQAMMIQALMENDARGGTRYTELIRAHFGVINPDFRLQRPEYIGGGKSQFNITPIAQTSTGGGGLGALGAAGTAVGQHRASYAATEHGIIIGLINIHTELAYQQGVETYWTKKTRYEFYWPELAGLGEQAILRREIYYDGVTANDTTVFGYQERWHEYRTKYSTVGGYFRSGIAGTLDAWHLAQSFASPPVLGQTFVTDTPPMARILAAGAAADKQQYYADIQIERTAVRPIPMFGTPATLGRF